MNFGVRSVHTIGPASSEDQSASRIFNLITGLPTESDRASASPGDVETVVFRALLTPNRSLSPTGFVVLMSLIVLISFIVGIAFLSMGAWPVLGFFGLDVLLIYWAFRANYRSAREFETVEVAPDVLTVTRCSADGRSEKFTFQTYWVRIFLDEEPSGRTSLRLTSHGRHLLFARFLSDHERREFADMLESEIRAALRS